MLNGFFEILGLTDKACDILRTVDKLEKIGTDKVAKILTDELGIDKERTESIIGFISTGGDTKSVLSSLEKYRGKNETFDTGADELATVIRNMSGFGVPDDFFTVDLTIARGLDYYTGTVYETVMSDHPEIGSVCSGGRYDSLAEYYTDRKLPGVGISIGLTRLFFVLQDKDLLNREYPSSPADVLIIPMTDDIAPAVSLATYFRENGIRTQLYSEKKKFKAKIGYADRLGIPFAVFLGDDEIESGRVSLKNMKTGEQLSLTREAAAEAVLGGIAESAGAAIIRA